MRFINKIKYFPFSTKLKWGGILSVEIANLYFWLCVSKYFNDPIVVLILVINVIFLVCSLIHISNRVCDN